MYFFKKETKPIKIKERNVNKYLLKRQKKGSNIYLKPKTSPK
jgi:hypothetical protein